MTAATTRQPSLQPSLDSIDLGALLDQFRVATEGLERTQHALRSEVARLQDELRESKRQLSRARELAALGEMAAGIAHEVRNPLGSIKLFAAALRDDLAGMPDEQRLADRIAEGVQRLDAVVGDVLRFARDQRLMIEPIDSCDLVERALADCDAAIRAVEANVTFSCEPVRFEGDSGMLRQALVNLLRNACDALEDRAAEMSRDIAIDIAETSLVDADGASVQAMAFRVRDSGPGIPEEVVTRVFNPFYSTRSSGTGLGLAITHRIVDAHGGRLSISNVSVGGAEARIVIPKAPRATDGAICQQEEAAV
ncbi:MAG: ATP-binding protein [Planctomycetota bacterium]